MQSYATLLWSKTHCGAYAQFKHVWEVHVSTSDAGKTQSVYLMKTDSMLWGWVGWSAPCPPGYLSLLLGVTEKEKVSKCVEGGFCAHPHAPPPSLFGWHGGEYYWDRRRKGAEFFPFLSCHNPDKNFSFAAAVCIERRAPLGTLRQFSPSANSSFGTAARKEMV